MTITASLICLIVALVFFLLGAFGVSASVSLERLRICGDSVGGDSQVRCCIE